MQGQGRQSQSNLLLSFMIKALYFQSSGLTNDCQIEALFKYTSLHFQELKGNETRLNKMFEKLKTNSKKVIATFPFF